MASLIGAEVAPPIGPIPAGYVGDTVVLRELDGR